MVPMQQLCIVDLAARVGVPRRRSTLLVIHSAAANVGGQIHRSVVTKMAPTATGIVVA